MKTIQGFAVKFEGFIPVGDGDPDGLIAGAQAARDLQSDDPKAKAAAFAKIKAGEVKAKFVRRRVPDDWTYDGTDEHETADQTEDAGEA